MHWGWLNNCVEAMLRSRQDLANLTPPITYVVPRFKLCVARLQLIWRAERSDSKCPAAVQLSQLGVFPTLDAVNIRSLKLLPNQQRNRAVAASIIRWLFRDLCQWQRSILEAVFNYKLRQTMRQTRLPALRARSKSPLLSARRLIQYAVSASCAG